MYKRQVDRTISPIKQPVGTVKPLSVAVVVNYVRDKDGDLKALPPEELSKLTNLVREAMGYSESRGDSLNLVNSQFNDGPPALPMWRDPEMISLFKTILAWLVGGVLALWLYRKVRRSVGDYLYPVSYTHLDVYKRQPEARPRRSTPCWRRRRAPCRRSRGWWCRARWSHRPAARSCP